MGSNKKISFIGGGNMARALIAGLRSKESKETSDIHVVDINSASLAELNKQFNLTTNIDIDAHISQSNIVVLAVKPQQMREAAEKLAPYLKDQLVISIAAGIRINNLSLWLNSYTKLVRTMPNMPALINKGITGMFATPGVSEDQRAVADEIMRAVGATVWLNDEALLDPLTAVSGSGPAYVFYFIEAMQKAAEEMGLSAGQGRELALATFLGASTLAAQSTESISNLRERVTSKGGTTYAALASMEQSGVSNAIVSALKAACDRSKELGDEFGS